MLLFRHALLDGENLGVSLASPWGASRLPSSFTATQLLADIKHGLVTLRWHRIPTSVLVRVVKPPGTLHLVIIFMQVACVLAFVLGVVTGAPANLQLLLVDPIT